MDARGVAVSAGGSAVVINGAPAVALWGAIESRLRSGIEPEQFIAAMPQSARALVTSLIAEFEKNELFIAEEADDGVAAAHPAIDYLRRVCRAPLAAARRTSGTSLTVRGATGALAEALGTQLSLCGFARVEIEPKGSEIAQVPVVLWGAERGRDEHKLVLIGRNAAFCAVGPVAGAITELSADDFARWATTSMSSVAPNWATLLAGQAALAALRAMGHPEERQTEDPERTTYVTSTGELVAEPRRFTAFDGVPRVSDLSLSALASNLVLNTPVPDFLEGISALWDPVFGVIPEVLPGTLPQHPVGLASSSGGELIGVGVSTAEARLDAIFELLGNSWTSSVQPAAQYGHIGFGPTDIGAAAAAFVSLLEAEIQVRPSPSETCTKFALDGHARWLASAAMLLLDRDVSMANMKLRGRWAGIVRSVADLGGGATGIAYGLDEHHAAEGALLRAVGRAQGGNPASSAVLDRHAARNRDLLGWAGLETEVRFSSLQARGWTENGVRAVAARVAS